MPSYCSFQPSLLAMRGVIVGGRDRQRRPQWHGQYSAFFSGEPVKLIPIPTIAASYNDEMNHVDRGDQRRSYLGYDHPIRRGAWQAIAWTFLLDIVLVNSFLLQLHGEPTWERYTSQKKWRECLYNAVFKAFHPQSRSRQAF